jgi:UbiD family decarboxylase
MGAITHMLTEKSGGAAPAILFDDVPGYARGYRTLYGELSSIGRIALTLGLPLARERKVDIVKTYHERMRRLEPVAPRFVNDGPILENVLTGARIDVLKFPVPRHHEQDNARYIGTADCVMTQDPDSGWFNLGAYRCQVYDGRTIGCQITEGKHGRIHRDTYFARGQAMKVVVLCGQDPLLFMLSSSPLPERMSEIEVAGGIRGAPIEVVRGPYTGFPIPADCEIAIEAEAVPGKVKPEGPFGEWMGYYSDDTVERPYLEVKTILHRNDPILTCAPQHKPVDETGLLKGIAGAAEIWRALDACGLPDIMGVWNHEAGPATRFTAIQIRQRYPGHARNVLHVASNCQGGAYAGKWTVVVDDDIDAGELDQVLWAMCTRFDPVTDIDLIQKAWASKRDPLYLPGNFNNRILIDACIPYEKKLAGTFPTVVDVSSELRAKLRAKFPALFAAR